MTKEKYRTKESWRKRLRSFKRNRLLPFWKEIEWPFLVVVWTLALILGYFGFSSYSIAIGDDSTGLDFAYRTIRLIGTRSGDLEGAIPWQIEIARFTLPAVAAYAALKGLFSVFRDNWQLFKLRYTKDHVVICGLGNRGFRLVHEFFEQGYKVVIIEQNERNSILEQCRTQAAAVLIGDATDQKMLHKARLHNAKYLVAVCSVDEINADIALQIKELDHRRKGPLLTAFIHIVDLELCNLLKSWAFSGEKNDSFSLEFFNVQDRGARLMLREYPPFDEKDNYDAVEKGPRILVIGLGKMGRSLVTQAARNWWMRKNNSQKKLRISIIDRAADDKVESLRHQYPQLDQTCELEPLSMDKDSPQFESGDYLFDSKGFLDTNIIYICFNDDVHALVNSLKLYQKVKDYKVPIVVRMSRKAGLTGLIYKERDGIDYGDIKPFAVLDKTCSLEALQGGTLEVLARAFHEDYIRQQKIEDKTVETNPSMVEWEDLAEDLKESNRELAAHIEIKLKAIGCQLQPLTDWDAASFKFSSQEIEFMSEMEHNRFWKERLKKGWTYKPGPKDINKKTNPSLIPWAELPEKEKDKDRNNVASMTYFLALAGFQINRRS